MPNAALNDEQALIDVIHQLLLEPPGRRNVDPLMSDLGDIAFEGVLFPELVDLMLLDGVDRREPVAEMVHAYFGG